MRRFLVTWVDTVGLLAAARDAGWKEDGEFGPLNYAPYEYHQRCRDFVRRADAVKFARVRTRIDFFGSVEVEEQELEWEPMGDGGPDRHSWETRRHCMVEKDDDTLPVWEAEDA